MNTHTSEEFINIFYNQGLRGFLRKYGMRLTPAEFFNSENSSMSFCYSKNISKSFLENCIVVGGPCIKDCENSITIEALFDVVNIIRTAKSLNARGIIFLGLQEEIIQYGEKRCYNQLGENLGKAINAISNFLGYNNVTVIDTRDQPYNLLMAEFLKRKKDFFNIKKVNTIFEFGNRKYKNHDKPWVDATKRVVIAHLPSFLNAYLKNNENKNILAVENTQQIKIIRLAQQIEATKSGPYQIAHLPVPSVSGAERMYRAPYWDKVYLNETRIELMAKQSLAPKNVYDFWMNMFSGLGLKGSNASLYNLVSTLNEIIYEKRTKQS